MPLSHRHTRSLKNICAVSALTLSLLWAAPLPAWAAEHMSEEEKQAIENLVRDYLMANPDVILESVRLYREQEAVAEQERVSATLASLGDILADDPITPIMGNPDGAITIVEFFDYQCGYCKKVLSVVKEMISTNQNIRLVFMEFPILGEESVLASRASLAIWINWPDRYEAFHNALMGGRGAISQSRIMEIAATLDLDTNQLAEAMNDPRINEALGDNQDLAESLGISGTPAFIIGDQLIPGAIDISTMRELVEKAAAS